MQWRPGTGKEWSLVGGRVPERLRRGRTVAKSDYMRVDFAEDVYLSVQNRLDWLSHSCTKENE